MEPMSVLCRVNTRPGSSAVMLGGVARPTNSLCDSSDLPASTPMYEPDSRVDSPVNSPPAKRGRTIQKCVSSTRSFVALLAICAFTTTARPSLDKVTVFTTPTSTFL